MVIVNVAPFERGSGAISGGNSRYVLPENGFAVNDFVETIAEFIKNARNSAVYPRYTAEGCSAEPAIGPAGDAVTCRLGWRCGHMQVGH